jgi:hypothetical protein
MTIVFIGDSITDMDRREGPLGLGNGYVDIVAGLLRDRGEEHHVVNTGIAGDRVVHLRHRFAADALDHRPDVGPGVVAPDTVHPSPMGHLLIARLWLAASDAFPTRSAIAGLTADPAEQTSSQEPVAF